LRRNLGVNEVMMVYKFLEALKKSWREYGWFLHVLLPPYDG
jgi:hypothetical protein